MVEFDHYTVDSANYTPIYTDIITSYKVLLKGGQRL